MRELMDINRLQTIIYTCLQAKEIRPDLSEDQMKEIINGVMSNYQRTLGISGTTGTIETTGTTGTPGTTGTTETTGTTGTTGPTGTTGTTGTTETSGIIGTTGITGITGTTDTSSIPITPNDINTGLGLFFTKKKLH